MARVALDLDYECGPGDLPPVCVVCGCDCNPEDRDVAKTFIHTAGWMYALLIFIFCGIPGLLLIVILGAVLRKKTRVFMPLCAAHRNYWVHGTLMAVSVVLMLFFLIGLLFYLVMDDGGVNPTPGWVFGAIGLGCVLLLIVAAILQRFRIRTTLIDDEIVQLTNVHAEFVAALEDQRDVIAAKRRARRQQKRTNRENPPSLREDLPNDQEW